MKNSKEAYAAELAVLAELAKGLSMTTETTFEDIVKEAFRRFSKDLDLQFKPGKATGLTSGLCSILNFSGKPVNGNIVMGISSSVVTATMPATGVEAQDWVNELSNRLIGRVDSVPSRIWRQPRSGHTQSGRIEKIGRRL